MTDRRVFCMASGLDRPHHDFARVHPDAGFNRNLALRAQAVGIATQLLLHRQRRMKCALRMVLMGHGRAEQGENSVTGRLRNVAAVAMHRLHHQMQHRVDDRARLLGIEIAHQLGRALDVGEQRRDRLALAVGRLRIRHGLTHSDRRCGTYLRWGKRRGHCPQNLKPGGFSNRHLEQISASELVHCPQNFIPSGFSNPHLLQRIIPYCLSAQLNSSSSALASFRSAVSKPSVNQP